MLLIDHVSFTSGILFFEHVYLRSQIKNLDIQQLNSFSVTYGLLQQRRPIAVKHLNLLSTIFELLRHQIIFSFSYFKLSILGFDVILENHHSLFECFTFQRYCFNFSWQRFSLCFTFLILLCYHMMSLLQFEHLCWNTSQLYVQCWYVLYMCVISFS